MHIHPKWPAAHIFKVQTSVTLRWHYVRPLNSCCINVQVYRRETPMVWNWNSAAMRIWPPCFVKSTCTQSHKFGQYQGYISARHFCHSYSFSCYHSQGKLQSTTWLNSYESSWGPWELGHIHSSEKTFAGSFDCVTAKLRPFPLTAQGCTVLPHHCRMLWSQSAAVSRGWMGLHSYAVKNSNKQRPLTTIQPLTKFSWPPAKFTYLATWFLAASLKNSSCYNYL